MCVSVVCHCHGFVFICADKVFKVFRTLGGVAKLNNHDFNSTV